MDYCIKQLKIRRATDALVEQEFAESLLDQIDTWRKLRNELCHDLAKKDLKDDAFKTLTLDGRDLMAKLASACMRHKKKQT